MDELVIGEKKYVSSKRAAEMTGYAKDYVGQLCREGRVEARLVGRNWYVLAAAIEDHRFGEPKAPEIEPEKAEEPPTIEKTWDSPRYISESVSSLPSINRLAEPRFEPAEALELEKASFVENPVESIQSVWQDWFNRAPLVEESAIEEQEIAPEAEIEPVTPALSKEIESESVPVALKTIEIEEEVLKMPSEEQIEPKREEERGARRGRSSIPARIGLFALAVMAVGVAFLGSGALKGEQISALHLDLLGGVALYDSENVAH